MCSSLLFYHLFVSSTNGSPHQYVFEPKWPSRRAAGFLERKKKLEILDTDLSGSILLQGDGNEDKKGTHTQNSSIYPFDDFSKMTLKSKSHMLYVSIKTVFYLI